MRFLYAGSTSKGRVVIGVEAVSFTPGATGRATGCFHVNVVVPSRLLGACGISAESGVGGSGFGAACRNLSLARSVVLSDLALLPSVLDVADSETVRERLPVLD